MKPWILLIIAGLLEAVWATSMKHASGFTRLWPSVLTIATMIVSFILLARAMTALPLGVAYAVWVGIGAVGAALAGVFLLGERLSPAQLACLLLIGAGIGGLKLATPSAPPPNAQQPGGTPHAAPPSLTPDSPAGGP